MADWMALVVKLGCFGAVLVSALAVTGRWFLKKVNAALDSYLAAYSQQQANIDARIANLEKLAAEQSRLTRVVESIKDGIAAQAKSRDNRWAFRKDVYSGLIRTSCTLFTIFNDSLALNRTYLSHSADPDAMRSWNTEATEHVQRLRAASSEFLTFVKLSNLATADWLIHRMIELTPALTVRFEFDLRSPGYAESIAVVLGQLNALLQSVCEAGRRDLWETDEPGVRAEVARQG